MVLLGSCFAENIGKRLSENNFKVSVNPFGILYNPLSISQAIDLLLTEKIFDDTDVFEHEGLFHTFYHHSSFSNADKFTFLKTINECRTDASREIKDADLLLLTFGTSYIFKERQRNSIVGNCHKLPSESFVRSRLNVTDIVSSWHELISKLREHNPDLKILFTVSPIRHWKDGAHNNQLSKATLLLAIEELINNNADLFYFPSYEIMLDELRDYRFYAEDMIHPSEVAIEYIWQCFANTYFDKNTSDLNKAWGVILRAINHRPFNPHTEQYKQFLRQTLLKVNDLRIKYPYFECEKEETLLSERLSHLE